MKKKKKKGNTHEALSIIEFQNFFFLSILFFSLYLFSSCAIYCSSLRVSQEYTYTQAPIFFHNLFFHFFPASLRYFFFFCNKKRKEGAFFPGYIYMSLPHNATLPLECKHSMIFPRNYPACNPSLFVHLLRKYLHRNENKLFFF